MLDQYVEDVGPTLYKCYQMFSVYQMYWDIDLPVLLKTQYIFGIIIKETCGYH